MKNRGSIAKLVNVVLFGMGSRTRSSNCGADTNVFVVLLMLGRWHLNRWYLLWSINVQLECQSIINDENHKAVPKKL